jgi:hypothetical protein
MQELLKLCLTGAGGRIVSTNDLSRVQIDDARFHNRAFVDSAGYGWVFLPWSLATHKDRQRESESRSMLDV